MTLRCTDNTYCLVYWPDSHLYRHDRSRTHYAPDAPLDERGGDIYFVETAFIEEVKGAQQFRNGDLYTVVDLSAKPDFIYMTSLPLFPVYGQSGVNEFGTDCFFVPVWLIKTLSLEYSTYEPDQLHMILRPWF